MLVIVIVLRTYNSSDRRFKTSIQNISSSDALNAVSALQGVSYRFLTEDFPQKNFPTTTQIGWLADNVEAVLPALVTEDSEG